MPGQSLEHKATGQATEWRNKMEFFFSVLLFVPAWPIQAAQISYHAARVPLSEWLAATHTHSVEECDIECARGCNTMWEKDFSCNAVIFDESSDDCTRALVLAPSPNTSTGLRIAFTSDARNGHPPFFAINRRLDGTAKNWDIYLSSGKENHSWFAVDLITAQKVKKVGIVQRVTIYAEYIKDIEIRVGDEKPFPGWTNGDTLYKSNTVCGFFAGPGIAGATDMVEYLDKSAFVDYKKVVGQLENSKF